MLGERVETRDAASEPRLRVLAQKTGRRDTETVSQTGGGRRQGLPGDMSAKSCTTSAPGRRR